MYINDKKLKYSYLSNLIYSKGKLVQALIFWAKPLVCRCEMFSGNIAKVSKFKTGLKYHLMEWCCYEV